MGQIDMLVNELPVPTWKRLKVNSKLIKNVQIEGTCQPLVSLQGNVCLKKTAQCCCVTEQQCTINDQLEQLPTGMGLAMDSLPGGTRTRLMAGKGPAKAVLTLQYLTGQQNNNLVEIVAQPGADLTVIMTYISSAEAQGTAGIRTKIAAGTGAKVRLVQVQLLGKGFRHLNDVGCALAENAGLDLLQLQLGGQEIYNGVRTELEGNLSNFKASIGYFGRQGQKLDMNFIANHYGKKTSCSMLADGVLQEQAEKTYRGTIDFKTGSSGSQGEEKETVLLLSDDVINQTVPLILCAEEDVQGNHGANIGRLDEEMLFYLCSRGFSRTRAADLLAKAKLKSICHRIDDAAVESLIEKYLEGVTTDV